MRFIHVICRNKSLTMKFGNLYKGNWLYAGLKHFVNFCVTNRSSYSYCILDLSDIRQQLPDKKAVHN